MIKMILFQNNRLLVTDENDVALYDDPNMLVVSEIKFEIQPPDLYSDGRRRLVIAFRDKTPGDHRHKRFQDALKAAHHELTTLHGLKAFDGASPSESFAINTQSALTKIEYALEPWKHGHNEASDDDDGDWPFSR